jgi:hypothetical protein
MPPEGEVSLQRSVSRRTPRSSAASIPLSIVTEATWAIWIDSSCCPIQRGLYRTTLERVMSTCVGRTRFRG